jgi:hypothetical protein
MQYPGHLDIFGNSLEATTCYNNLAEASPVRIYFNLLFARDSLSDGELVIARSEERDTGIRLLYYLDPQFRQMSKNAYDG